MKRAWKTSTTCPSCGKRLTIIDGMKAPTPFYLPCSGCRARLRVHHPVLVPAVVTIAPIFVILPALGALIAITYGAPWALFYAFFWLLGLIALEIGCSLFLFTNARFIAESRTAAAPAAAPAVTSAGCPLPATTHPAQETAPTASGGAGHWWTQYDLLPKDEDRTINRQNR